MPIVVEFCGETVAVNGDAPFTIGRDADLSVDDNPFLHRRFLRLDYREPLWWISNVGTRLSATVSDGDGFMQSWIGPGGQAPLVFATSVVRFSAGRTMYELTILDSSPAFVAAAPEESAVGVTTRGAVTFTLAQRQLIVALAEPILKSGKTVGTLPTSGEVATRLGWSLTRFNRKLDNVCDKLASMGVQGLRGDSARAAHSRKARLVEYALSMRLVSVEDLSLLNASDRAGLEGSTASLPKVPREAQLADAYLRRSRS